MSDKIIMDHLRLALQPKGSAQLVQLGFLDAGVGNTAFYRDGFVRRALDEMAVRISIVTSGIDEFTPLERLAVELLMSSAYIGTPRSVASMIQNAVNRASGQAEQDVV